MPDYPEPTACGGSAMCYGRSGGEGYIWLMHGPDESMDFRFHRYDIDGNTWEERTAMPQTGAKVGWGGALAYVPASQDSGWIFGLKGNHTKEFYAYYTERDLWVQCPETPTNAGPGGALCYGRTVGDTVIVYAQTMTWIPDNEEPSVSWFYHFKFHVDSGPATGIWQALQFSPYFTDAGGALAFSDPIALGSDSGVVFRSPGNYTLLFGFHVIGGNWDMWGELSMFGPGGALAADPDGGPYVWIFPGAGIVGNRTWHLLDRRTGLFTEFDKPPDATWRPQHGGAAICHDGQHLYAQLGNDPEFPQEFRRYHLVEDGGAQGGNVAGRSGPAVRVVVGPGMHRFSLTGARPGPAVLRILDPAGRTVSLTRTSIALGENEFVWHHGRAGAGVLFYRLETPTGSAVGKLTILR